MVEPVGVLTAVKSLLAKKGAEVAWQRIYACFRPDRLKREIESALKSDPAVVQPHPTLCRERLDTQAAMLLLQTAVTKDLESLADFLLHAQLIDLPVYPVERPTSYEVVWACIAKTVIDGVCVAVAKDEELSRQLLLSAEQHSHLERQQILTEVQALRVESAQYADQLQRIENLASRAADSSHATLICDAAAVRTINLLTEQNEQLEQQLRDQLDEKTELLWSIVLKEIQSHNFLKATAKGQELAEWLDAKSQGASTSARGRAYLLLAQLALIESSELGERQDDFTKSRDLFEKARVEFGDDPAVENKLRLSNFQAKLLSIDGRHDQALEILGTATDPQSITTRLLIFIDRDEMERAAEVIGDLPFDKKWCDLAAFVFARIDNPKRAQAALSWAIAQSDAVIECRCRVAIAKATLIRLTAEHGNSAFSVLSICSTAATAVNEVLICLSPIVNECNVLQTVGSGLAADAVGFAYSCHRVLGQLAEARSAVSLLRDRRPVHLEYATAMLRGDVTFDAQIANGLRNDYPNWFVAQDMALAIDIRSGLESAEILNRAVDLAKLTTETSEREKLVRVIVQTSANSEIDVTDKAISLVERLVGREHFFVRLLEANKWLREGAVEHFEEVLTTLETENDYLLDQFRAQLLIKKHKYAEAAEILARVGLYMSEPDLLKYAAELALGAKPRRLDLAISALESALAVVPHDIAANRILAFTYIQLQGFASAADCFARMKEIEPKELTHLLNHAHCCAMANQPDDALAIYQELCQKPDAPIVAYLAWASLLSELGNSQKGFATLHAIREQHWDEPAFVANYLNLAHAANQDKLAHEGFQQLWKLRESGKAPLEILQPKSLDDLIQFTDDARARRKFLLDQSVVGKLPWLFVESLLWNVPYWGWRIRTQPMTWIFDDAHNRASFSLYATNSYATLRDDNRNSLHRITCSGPGGPAVIDLSALITLHRLGLLAKAIEYFGHITLPPSYLAGVLQQSGRLRPHQLSQKSSLDAIKAAIDARKLHVNLENGGLPVIDEYRDGNEPMHYRIRDVLNLLNRLGRISQTQMDAALSVAHRPPIASDSGRELSARDHIIATLSTLQTIAKQGLLPALCDSFDSVSISPSDHEHLIQELLGFEFAAETLSWHEDLWRFLAESNCVDASTLILRAHELEPENDLDEDENPEGNRVTATDAMLLAEQESLPLLIDDRVCQNMLLQLKLRDPAAAFGTDCLLEGMLNAGQIDAVQTASAYLQLMDWRYRFLIVPVSILHTISKDFSQHDLHSVARYLHDSMRDPGLFGGPEQTEPPVPMAFQYYQEWLKVIATFVAELWLGQSVSDERATELTDWAMKEFVPTVPSVLGDRIGRVANFSAFTVLHHAILRLCETPNYPRANTALRIIAAGLGLDNEQFVRIAADIIDSHG